ncbi:MAG: U32 family peptidase [Lachnospiraceae bacterium]|nr:U32 family peptidase [Lachnospiraceae bacterium]
MRSKKPELLIPAKGPEELKVAVSFGADAVYLGGEAFGLRAHAKNFSNEEIAEGIEFAHKRGVKIYITANILAHNKDIVEAADFLKGMKELGPDALIISDPGIFSLAREICPEIDIHISTQANNCNFYTCLFWGKLGAKRIVTARELSLREIKEIRENIPEGLEIETFVHGAMCISYSGRCLLSGFFTGRSANHGECAHPCRWQYSVMEETRPGEYLPVEENERGTFIFNSKDLCMIEHIPELIDAGIDSFKIEGRMKNSLYVACVTRVYRRAIDDCLKDVELYRKNMDWYKEEIKKCTVRPYTTAFFFGKPGEDAQIYDSNTYISEYTLLGVIHEKDDKGRAVIYQKNKFLAGDEIEIVHKDFTSDFATVNAIYDEDENEMESAPHPKQRLSLELSADFDVYDVLRINK